MSLVLILKNNRLMVQLQYTGMLLHLQPMNLIQVQIALLLQLMMEI